MGRAIELGRAMLVAAVAAVALVGCGREFNAYDGSVQDVARVGTIRGDYTTDSYGHSSYENRGVRNLVHCSDSIREAEREIAPHPSLKPQKLLRHLVRASLPTGEGVVLDPFMGSGSTIAAALALGVKAIGVERQPEYFGMAVSAVPRLATLEAR